ncbi:MAG: hypothetical protein V3T05_08840 [Myxococcota bacterium]
MNRPKLIFERAVDVVRRRPYEALIVAAVGFSCAYFFQGGGWNQNAHFATTVAMVEDGTVALDRYRESTGDLSHAGNNIVSAKPIGTALVAVPAYVVARTVTLVVGNHGDRVILRCYLTTVMTAGGALVMIALLLFRLFSRRLAPPDAALLATAMVLATPLLPNSTMLTSHPLVALAALAAYAALAEPRADGQELGAGRMLVAGLLAGLPACFEYMAAVLLLPLGVYALWQARPRHRILFFSLGVGLIALVPLTHHALVYGDPLHTGYDSLVNARFAADAERGLMGFDGLSIHRLYQLTFGSFRGFFFLSPFLIAALPGAIRMVRDPATRPEGIVAGASALMILLMVASLAYWHSGSAVGSRYALLFVLFSAMPIAAILVAHRIWIAIGMGVGFCFMVLATSVTALPPPPPARGQLPNVVVWFWQRFVNGNLASWQQAIIIEDGVGAGDPTLPFAFNLGHMLGLPRLWSLLPYVVAMGGLGYAAYRLVRRQIGERDEPCGLTEGIES